MEVGYRKNEWTVLYADCDGLYEVQYFDTRQEALDFTATLYTPIACVTTRFYQRFIESTVYALNKGR